MRRKRGSALIVAIAILGIVTLISAPLYQTLAQWRVGYRQIIANEQARLEARYQAWLKQESGED